LTRGSATIFPRQASSYDLSCQPQVQLPPSVIFSRFVPGWFQFVLEHLELPNFVVWQDALRLLLFEPNPRNCKVLRKAVLKWQRQGGLGDDNMCVVRHSA